MSRTSTLILLGVLTILAPFSGLPAEIRTLLAVIFGAGIAGIGLLIRADEAREQGVGESAIASETSETQATESAPTGVSPV